MLAAWAGVVERRDGDHRDRDRASVVGSNKLGGLWGHCVRY